MLNRYAFIGADRGTWQVTVCRPVTGEPLPAASALSVTPVAELAEAPAATWRLDGLISNLRYATREEVGRLRAVQEPLGRPRARCAAMIPIRKSAAWWALAQDERRAIFEEQSRHTAIGLGYLPAVSRQLYHARDLAEPFDFITWFEYAPEDAAAFEDLLGKLRATAEWGFIEREVDIRLERAG